MFIIQKVRKVWTKDMEETKFIYRFILKYILLYWSILGGFCFTVFVSVLENGSDDDNFHWDRDIFNLDLWFNFRWSRVGPNLEHFLFGFVMTFLIIWSLQLYAESKKKL